MSGGYTDKRSMLWLLKTRNYTYLITIVEHKFREKRDESKFNVNFPYMCSNMHLHLPTSEDLLNDNEFAKRNTFHQTRTLLFQTMQKYKKSSHRHSILTNIKNYKMVYICQCVVCYY